jgi:CheY-like chemotaxis protein
MGLAALLVRLTGAFFGFVATLRFAVLARGFAWPEVFRRVAGLAAPVFLGFFGFIKNGPCQGWSVRLGRLSAEFRRCNGNLGSVVSGSRSACKGAIAGIESPQRSQLMGASKSKSRKDQPPSRRIFIVDDEPMLLELAAKIIGGLNYDVEAFSNPEKALRAYSESTSPPDLVITDFAMHQMDGLDLIRECRRLHPKQKIILLSGTVDQTVFAGTGVRPDRFLEKPYQPTDLAAAIQDVLAD